MGDQQFATGLCKKDQRTAQAVGLVLERVKRASKVSVSNAVAVKKSILAKYALLRDAKRELEQTLQKKEGEEEEEEEEEDFPDEDDLGDVFGGGAGLSPEETAVCQALLTTLAALEQTAKGSMHYLTTGVGSDFEASRLQGNVIAMEGVSEELSSLSGLVDELVMAVSDGVDDTAEAKEKTLKVSRVVDSLETHLRSLIGPTSKEAGGRGAAKSGLPEGLSDVLSGSRAGLSMLEAALNEVA